MACAPALREGSPPEKVPYREKFGPYLVKKEFDEEGAVEGAILKVDLGFTGWNLEHLHPTRVTLVFEKMGQVDLTEISIEDDYLYIRGPVFLPGGDVLKTVGISVHGSGYWTITDLDKEIATGRVLTLTTYTELDMSSITPSASHPASEWNPYTYIIEEPTEGMLGIQAYHFGARMYDPVVAGFLSTDPAGEFFHSYSYTLGNPVFYLDPTGMRVTDWEGKNSTYNREDYLFMLGFPGGLDDIADYVNSDEDYTFEEMWDDWGGSQRRGDHLLDGSGFRPGALDMPVAEVRKADYEYNAASVEYAATLLRSSHEEKVRPMAYDREFISIQRDMNYDEIAYGFRDATIAEVAFIGGATAGYYAGPVVYATIKTATPYVTKAVITGGTAATAGAKAGYRHAEAGAARTHLAWQGLRWQVRTGARFVFDFVTGYYTETYTPPITSPGGAAAGVVQELQR